MKKLAELKWNKVLELKYLSNPEEGDMFTEPNYDGNKIFEIYYTAHQIGLLIEYESKFGGGIQNCLIPINTNSFSNCEEKGLLVGAEAFNDERKFNEQGSTNFIVIVNLINYDHTMPSGFSISKVKGFNADGSLISENINNYLYQLHAKVSLVRLE